MSRLKITCALIIFGFILEAQELELIPISSGFENITDIAFTADGRMFVVEQEGKIKLVQDGNTLSQDFLDIDNLVNNNLDERGLLGLAFHPNYDNNGYFFVNYSNNSGNSVIARYTVSASDANLADASTGKIIMTIQQPEWNHNGGCLKFGHDGYLYIGTGDGGSGGDPWNNAQNPQALLGKMLRIDIDNGDPYGIPTDNPFVNDDSVLDEIWATGLRNPWRYSFDKETGDLWIGDVGQGEKEEIDFQDADSPGGENYGWRCYEGTDQYSTDVCNDNYVNPIFEVNHSGGFSGPCSITGGFVYRGTKHPSLYGKYICTDFCDGSFYYVEPNGTGGWASTELGILTGAISTFGEDAEGELYCGYLYGTIYKISVEGSNSISNIPELEQFEVTPNPFLNELIIEINSHTSVDMKMELMDQTGRIVYSEEINVMGDFYKKIEPEQLSTGVYFLNLKSPKGTATKKVIKQ